MADTVVYSGSFDALYDYRFGMLEYRAVSFEHESSIQRITKAMPLLTYVDVDVPWTRITEHKWFNFGKKDDGADCNYTVISREFSSEWKPGDIRAYPINDSVNNELYQPIQGPCRYGSNLCRRPIGRVQIHGYGRCYRLRSRFIYSTSALPSMSSCPHGLVVMVSPGFSECVSQTLPPTTQSSPILVSPPSMVAPEYMMTLSPMSG